ncbi:hypothetical protein MTQ00_08280 [Chryseobacterium sp. B21-037]|uniref:hypothetical protein n=1 Tax=Chryseobacterium sp. B21-037 TaxID=2926038 RepID=UPI002359AF86|nr:hypothetical protein [Chryseobacterium sp. B21-037]MDC8104534.1 hypothetical protein [Chryseobacterium sp. B21-037]
MKRKIILLGTLLFLTNKLDAQYVPKILPPSPNATSIAKFVESPVSYYRGSANIGIPLISVDTGDIPLNVSIQYDTKGIRVGEVASSVGAGWSLSAGGLITRQVRQRPDEYTRGYLTYSYNSTFETNATVRQQLNNENASNGDSDTPVDEDPDLFFINFLGRSAKFVIDNVTKKAVVQSFDDWKIDIDYEDASAGNFRINRIIITDESGNKYYFGKDSTGTNSAYDVVTSVSSGIITDTPKNEENGYKTAWHLKEVKTQKDTYVFNYASEQVVTYSKSDLNKGDNMGSISLSTTTTTQQILQTISFPNGTVEFIFNQSEREDLKGGKALNNIILKDKIGTQIRKVSLVQNYRLGNGDNNNIHPVVLSKDTKSDKRLFLNQINEVGRDESIISTYKLEYNPGELPNRHSNSIDYWGYFNGKPNKMNIFTDVVEANRDVYGNFAEAGILTKIIYPTGGSENFYYEDNQVLVPNYFSLFMLSNPSRIVYDEKSTAVAKTSNIFVLNNGSPTLGKYIKEFEIPSMYGSKLSFNAMLGVGCTSVETADCKTKVRLYRYNKDTRAILATYVITQGNNVDLINPPIESGSYRLEVSNPSFTLSDSENFETNPFSIVLRWKEQKPNIPINSFVGGGRRISRIEVNENGRITKRKFTYTLDDGTTSGKLLGIPDYMCVIKKYGNVPLVAGQLSNRIQPMSSFNNAGQVGYSQVTESFLSADDSVLWTKKYTFSNYSDGGEYYRFPYHLPDDTDWARGLNLKTISYDYSGKIVETLENKYNFWGEEFSPYRFFKTYDGTLTTNAPSTELIPTPPTQAPSSYILSHAIKSVPMYKWGKYLSDPTDPNPAGSSDVYRTAFFYGGMIRNYQKIKTEYVNGSPILVTYVNTVQDSNSHHQVTSQKTTYPDQTIEETIYQYAHEKGNQLMIDKNMVSIPLETTTTQTTGSVNKVVDKTETIYPTALPHAVTGNLVLPLSVNSFDIVNNTPSIEITYNKYDSKGNIQQYTTKEGVPTTIIWGYNQTQPIAKIEGAKLSDISQSLIDSIVNPSNTDAAAGVNNDETSFLLALDNFRKNSALTNYQVTTYTYDPLVGVRSITQPSGIREVYVYDTANRLKEVRIREKDSTGTYVLKTVKEFKYNYKP